jgi:plasmid stabilization system protein ParE
MKKYEFVLMDEAESDLDEAFIWYELQRPGLGIIFIEDVEKVFQFIEQNPVASERIYQKIHRKVVKRFPYSIYYRLDDAYLQIQVVGILHHKRNPKTWKDRLI